MLVSGGVFDEDFRKVVASLAGLLDVSSSEKPIGHFQTIRLGLRVAHPLIKNSVGLVCRSTFKKGGLCWRARQAVFAKLVELLWGG